MGGKGDRSNWIGPLGGYRYFFQSSETLSRYIEELGEALTKV